jgi:hypothetical protein
MSDRTLLDTFIRNPFYVHTPANAFGEPLVSPHNDVKYEVRSVHEGKKCFHKTKCGPEARIAMGYLNQIHRTEMCFAAGI